MHVPKEEWLVRDNLWIVQQLGLNPWELAAKMAAGQPAKQVYGRDEYMEGQFLPEVYRAKDNSVDEQVLELLNEVYNHKLINRICDFYADNAVVHSICNQDQIDHDEIQGAVISLLSSFPNARMIVESWEIYDGLDVMRQLCLGDEPATEA